VEAAPTGIVELEGHAGILDRDAGAVARAGWTAGSTIRSAMEVLRWLAFFVLAILLIVAGLFWLMGRPLPIPNF